jgi:DNA polymerase IV
MALRTLAVDFNSFFASCEAQENPRIRGSAIGVVPVMADTSCIIAANYPAKACGIKTGTGVADAKRLCPQINLIEARPKVYVGYHHRLVEIIESCIHVSEIRSIDEVECELTRTFAPLEKALKVAREIKAKVGREVGPSMSSSIGIAPNWFLAKLATDMQKPDGLTVLDDADIPQRLLHLEIDDFLGIGDSMGARLRAAGIDTVAKLYAAPKGQLRSIWGSVEGERIFGRLRGEDIPSPNEKNKSVGHSHVLPPYLRTPVKAHAVMHRLLQKAAMRLRHIGYYATGLSAYIGYLDGQRWSHDLRLTETQDTLALTKALNMLLIQPGANRRRPAQVAVTLLKLRPPEIYTPELFDREQQEARERLCGAVDIVNQTFGNGSVFFGGAFGATENAPMRISFTCIPKPEIEEIDPTRNRRLRPRPPTPKTESD